MKNGFLRIVGIALIAFLGRAENRPAIQALGATNSAPTSAGVAHGADPAFDFAAVSARRFPPPTPLAEAVVATNFSRRFTFPHSTGGVWRLEFDYRLDHSEGRRIGGARARVLFGPKIMPWGPDVRGPMISDSGVDSGALYPWRSIMEVLPGMEFADITFELFGKGDFRVANVRFEEIPPNPTPVVLELPFGGCFDGAFHIGAGQAGVPVFSWRTSLDEETPPGRFGCRITAPPGFTFVDASQMHLRQLFVATTRKDICWSMPFVMYPVHVFEFVSTPAPDAVQLCAPGAISSCTFSSAGSCAAWHTGHGSHLVIVSCTPYETVSHEADTETRMFV